MDTPRHCFRAFHAGVRNLALVIGGVSLLLLAAACSDQANLLLLPESAAAPAGLAHSVSPTSVVRYQSRLDADMCLTASGDVRGAPLVIATCTGGAEQEFQWNGSELRFGALCVDALGGRGNNGDAIGLWTCHGGRNQQWSFSGSGEFIGIHGKCIDVSLGNGGDGTALILFSCHGGPNQRWRPEGGGGDPSTSIFPGDDIQSKVNAHPAGTVFLLKAGVHRMQQVTPRDGQQFIGEPGAVLNGSRLLTSFEREGSFWVATDQTQQGMVHGRCWVEPDGRRYEGCRHPENLYINDRPLWQVMSLAEVAPGKWYFDYDADRIYFVDDPRGKKVETSVASLAFTGSASGVVIRGLTIEKYANPGQHGAVHGSNGNGWVVEDNVVHLNHGVGIRIGERMQVRGNRALRNGQTGVGGSGDDVVVEDNEIAFNHTGGYSWTWENGGAKFIATRHLVLRNNHVHDNYGPGLWLDIDNIHTLYEGNLIEDNNNAGIWHELSYDAVIRNNTVRGNGFGYSEWLWGAGIQIANSPNVEVYGNRVENNANGIVGIQQARGDGRYGPWKLRNFRVRDNVIRMPEGRSGIAVDDGDPVPGSPAGGNRFERNTYHVPEPDSGRWHWTVSGGRVNWQEWRGLGQDRNGRVNP